MNSQIIGTVVCVLIFINQSSGDIKNFKCDNEMLIMCKCLEVKDSFIVDCSNSGLKTIPADIPFRTTHLYLNNNKIKILRNNAFAHSKTGLPNLVTLSIRSNAMRRVEIKAFNGLHYLKELDLHNNNLEFEDSFPKSVFAPISKSLEVLDIRRNLLGDLSQIDYPVSVGELIGLRELRIDCLKNKSLPMEYGKLKNLTKLSFADGRKEVELIRDDMFVAVSKAGITDLSLAELNIETFGSHTFSWLPKLKTLDLSNNLYFFDRVENIENTIPSLKKTAIRTLKLSNTGIGHLKSETYLLEVLGELHLKELMMDKNLIGNLDPVFSEYLPDLEVLSLANNFIDFDASLSNDLFRLKNLTGLNVSWQNMDGINSNESKLRGKRLHTIQRKESLHFCSDSYLACSVIPPPKMQWMDISHVGKDMEHFPELVLLGNSTLRSIDMSFNRISTIKHLIYCPSSELFGVFPQIKAIIVNNNALQCINTSFFNYCNWSSLTSLHLRNNQLGRTEGNVCNRDKNNTLGFLKPAINLEYLDLAGNQIQDAQDFSEIQGLTKLKVIDLSNNELHSFSMALHNMTALSRLNLSNNNIRCFSMSTIIQLNKLQKLKSNSDIIEVELSGNLLSCTCECFDFFHWMMVTDLIVTNWNTYECEFNDGTKKSLNRLSHIVAALESQCFGIQWLKLHIIFGILSNMCITIICLLYRGRRTIKSLLSVYWRLNALEEKKDTRDESKYLFSAFVSCDHRDAKFFVYRKLLPNLETKESKLKFCIAQRNFLVGATIIDNIIRAISKSRKVIFIVSQYFLTSQWCQEELIIAHHVSIRIR